VSGAARQGQGSGVAGAHRGTCFCGALEIETSGTPEQMGYCHCSSCRAYSGGPLTAFVLFRSDRVRVTRGAGLLGRFSRTPMSDRQFCTRCGGHLMTAHPDLGLTDVYPAVIPTLPFRPTIHLHYAEAVLRMRDGLPKLRDFPGEAGGSGETMPE
jgi:hypothetical protein